MRWTIVTALLLAVTSCAPRPGPHNQIVLAMASAPVTLDPGVGADEASQKIDQLIFSSLARIDEHLRVVPDLATRLEQVDPETYLVEIPPHVRFHDGHEMTADDVAYTYRRLLDPAFVSTRKGAYRNLASVDVRGPYALTFHLKAPSSAFLVNFIMGIVPRGAGADTARHPIGSGPYRLDEFAADDHVTLSAFRDYYRGAPANDGLLIRTIPDDTMRGLELRKGSVDLIVNDLSPDLVHVLARDSQLTLVTSQGTDYAYVGFNLRDPVLRDRRVRQAIGYAVDPDAIVEYLRRGFATRATGIVPPASWAYASDVFRFTHDPARAKALLDEAGFRDPDGEGPGARLHLTLSTSTDERYRLQAAVIQAQLREVGIDLEVRSIEFATLFADVVKGNAQMYTLQWTGVTDPDILRRVFYSSQVPPDGFNRGHYDNPEADRLIDAATAAADETTRAGLYRDAQRVIANDAPYISLWYKTNVAVARANLTGVSLSPIADFGFLRLVTRQ